MSQSILFPYTYDTHLGSCRSALLKLQENKERIINGLTQNRDMQFDIVLYSGKHCQIDFNSTEALCDMVLDTFIVEIDKESIFRKWEHFTGSLTYVVEGCAEDFHDSWNAKSLWLNPKRWELVEYLIDCINTELNR